MKKIASLLLFFALFKINAQTKIAPVPKDGMESFVKELTDNIIFPESYYENEGLTLRISVDSVSNVKLVTLKPYNAEFYKELKLFVESTEWVSGTIDNVPNTQVISFPIKLITESNRSFQKASPKIGLYKFFDGMYHAVRIPENLIWKEKYRVIFIVTKEGDVKDIEFYPINSDKNFERDVKSYVRRTKWNPAYENGKPVESRFTLPIKLKVKNN